MGILCTISVGQRFNHVKKYPKKKKKKGKKEKQVGIMRAVPCFLVATSFDFSLRRHVKRQTVGLQK